MRKVARGSGMEVAGAMRTDSRPRKNVRRCAVPVSGPSLGFHLSLVREEVSNLTKGVIFELQ